MSQDLERAKAIVQNSDATCAIVGGNTVYQSTLRGVTPLLQWLDEGVDMMGFCAADKVVGRGAAYLYRLLGVRSVYGQVMSAGAVKVLRAGGIEVSWGSLTESIRNRQNTGICPLELATANIEEPENALFIIRSNLPK